jgi:hypothetical protein
MPAVLTHKTIMLLARQRLQEIEEALKVKKLAAATPRSNIENAVQELASKALLYLNSSPPPSTDFPGAPYVKPLGSGVSKFAVMGAMGPDISGFSNALAPGQSWLFDNIHKGYPDEDREAVVAGTCDFIFELWRKVSASITSEVTDVNTRNAQLNKMRAYVLGHLCHLAGDIISHPLINEIEWRSATFSRSKLEHADGEQSHDALVAKQVLLRDSTRAGAAWDAWWPTLNEIPSQFFSAYSDALEQTYTAVSARRTGLAEFEERLTPLGPPAATADFIKDGYSLYRSGVISIAYHYTTWNWFAFLLPVWAPIMTLPLLGGAFEITREFFVETPAGVKKEDSWSGLLSLGFALGSAAALTYSIWLATLTMRGVDAQAIYGIVANSISTVLGIAFFFTLLSKDVSATVRFALFVGVPGLVALIQLAMWIVFTAKSGSGRRAKLALALAGMLLAPVIAALLAALLFWGLRGDDGKLEPGWFLLASGIWLLAWGAIGLLICRFVLRDAKIPETAGDIAQKKLFVRLFDDASLYRDSRIPGTGLAGRFFPSARRKLLKLWWEGPGDLFIRPDRYRLVFNFTDQNTATSQFVQAPIGPMTLGQFIKELNRLVKGPGGELNKLKAAMVYSGDPDYELAPGGTFSDHGEEEDGERKHRIEALKFKKLGTSADDSSPYILYHAPKPAQSVRFSTTGPVDTLGKTEDELTTVADGIGYPYVYDPLAVDDQSVMGYAADFAALLCMGAVTHLDSAVAEPDKVYQVFRNWSLDRRRVNEWRMLVAGGAVSEKDGHPEKWDSAMLKPPDPAAWTTRMPANQAAVGEGAALSLGWVPMLRAWLDVAHTPDASAMTPGSLYPGAPSSLALSRGLAYVLDLPEPA